MDLMVGVDVGGTKTAALVVDADDRALGRVEIPTPRSHVAEAVISAARAALASVSAGPEDVVAVGVACPGQVDSAAGTIRLAVNLEADDLPLARIVEDALGTPCFIEHDARAAAAWLHHEAGDGTCDLAYLSIGTGIAAGVVVNGSLIRGANGLAGEIGHVLADPNGPACTCGLTGCLEAVVAGPAIERRGREAVERGETTELSSAEVTTEAVYRAAAGGDPVAREIAEEVGSYLARAVRGLALSFGVERVYVGGGVARAGRPFIEPVERALQRERAAAALVARAVPTDVLRVVPADADAVARGAVVIARAGSAGSFVHGIKGRKEVAPRVDC